MDNESNPNDEEKLKSLLETLRKNDEKVPKRNVLRTKYKKPVPGTERKAIERKWQTGC